MRGKKQHPEWTAIGGRHSLACLRPGGGDGVLGSRCKSFVEQVCIGNVLTRIQNGDRLHPIPNQTRANPGQLEFAVTYPPSVPAVLGPPDTVQVATQRAREALNDQRETARRALLHQRGDLLAGSGVSAECFFFTELKIIWTAMQARAVLTGNPEHTQLHPVQVRSCSAFIRAAHSEHFLLARHSAHATS